MPERAQQPSLTDAVERVFDVGQDLVASRIDLRAEEITERGRAALTASLGSAAGGIIALIGWFWIVAGIAEVLETYMPRPTAMVLIGVIHLAAGVGVVLWARRQDDGTPAIGGDA